MEIRPVHGVARSSHGVSRRKMMALRAEPALARSAQIIYSVQLHVNSMQLRVLLMPWLPAAPNNPWSNTSAQNA